MLTIDDDMKETISEIANAALQTVDLLSTRLRQNLVESTPAGLSIIEGAAFRAVRAMTRLQPPEKKKRSISPSGWDAPCRC